jgi:hypothetical protein
MAIPGGVGKSGQNRKAVFILGVNIAGFFLEQT